MGIENKEDKVQIYRSQELKWSIVLKTGIKLFSTGIVFLALVFIILNYFSIIPLSKTYPALNLLPHKEIGKEQKIAALLSPTPKPTAVKISGNPFENQARIEGTDLTLEVISGRVSDLLNKNNGIMIYVQKTNGEIISKPFFAPNNIKPTLATGKYKATEKEVSLNTLKKGDIVMISFMEDVNTKEGQVSGIRISR